MEDPSLGRPAEHGLGIGLGLDRGIKADGEQRIVLIVQNEEAVARGPTTRQVEIFPGHDAALTHSEDIADVVIDRLGLGPGRVLVEGQKAVALAVAVRPVAGDLVELHQLRTRQKRFRIELFAVLVIGDGLAEVASPCGRCACPAVGKLRTGLAGDDLFVEGQGLVVTARLEQFLRLAIGCRRPGGVGFGRACGSEAEYQAEQECKAKGEAESGLSPIAAAAKRLRDGDDPIPPPCWRRLP